jgi:hypothetical protein
MSPSTDCMKAKSVSRSSKSFRFNVQLAFRAKMRQGRRSMYVINDISYILHPESTNKKKNIRYQNIRQSAMRRRKEPEVELQHIRMQDDLWLRNISYRSSYEVLNGFLSPHLCTSISSVARKERTLAVVHCISLSIDVDER